MIPRLPAALVIAALVAATAAAQPPPVQTPPPQTLPAQAPAAAAPAPTPPRPADAPEIGVILVQRILDESAEGKAVAAKLQAFQQAKLAALTDRNKQLEAAQLKVNTLAAGGDERLAAQKEADRLQVEIQRMQQDAQAELDDARTTQYREFERKLGPVVQQIFIERQLRLIISRETEGLLWASPEIDLTGEVIKRFDQAMAAAVKPPAPGKAPGPDPR